MPTERVDLSGVASVFEEYAARDYHGASPLYEKLSLAIAKDEELLRIAARGRSAIPNLFLEAVHLLLMPSEDEPLAEYYPGLRKVPRSDNELYPTFRAFCLQHRDELLETVMKRTVQTNEVNRCGYLFPAFHVVSRLIWGKPLALIDIGTSAGLHLLCDRYRYDYGRRILYGDGDSPVKIRVELRGSKVPNFSVTKLTIAYRIGLDLQPIRPGDREEQAWLLALIWPEHDDRRQLLHRALEVVALEEENMSLIAGDALELLPGELSAIPDNVVPCVFQTHIWRQLSGDARSSLTSTLEDFGRQRELFFVSALRRLTLERFAPGSRDKWVLADYEQHGRWLEWLEVPEQVSK